MSSRAVAALALVLCACGAPAQEAPPPYTPANSPEAPTTCPDQAAAAKEAREKAIEIPSKKGEAARAVFLLAECEKQRLERTRIAAPNADVYLHEVGAARQEYETVRNLYEEVMNYGSPLWSLAAAVRLGDIRVTFAGKVEKGRPRDLMPEDVQGITEVLRNEAATSYRTGLRLGKAAPDEESQRWSRAACDGLRAIEPGASCEP